MKKSKSKEAHVSKSKVGSGDYYGSGIRNPIGKVRDVMGLTPTNPKKLKNPPKSLA